jgi:hypothetical protein
VASFQKFNSFVEALAEKKHDLGADTLKVLLANTAPVATNSVKADLTEITAGNGYTAGGNTATVSSSAQTSGTYKLVLGDPATCQRGQCWTLPLCRALQRHSHQQGANRLLGLRQQHHPCRW